ncbi:tyrosine-type recombinase/integrase [Mycobacterium marinum]|uniref:tyrosine-type recombinase/integrase n=1 Tax=Mycobacterium marinum TaxID=1781 RepID=UPI0021580CE3|nr:tyrosine-type recombinase/integrase [Mycobacterium marinum]
MRADELVRANIGDIRVTDGDGGVIHVRGKGNKDRRIPVEQVLIDELNAYLESRAERFPRDTKRRTVARGLAAWPAAAPLFAGTDGQRITRGALQYRVLRAFKKAGLDSQRARGVLVHVAGPRELVRGERESFIGGYRRQHSGQAVGSPAMNAADDGCTRASSRR